MAGAGKRGAVNRSARGCQPRSGPVYLSRCRLVMLWRGMLRTPALLLSLALILPLAACATAGDYPSLERRAAERTMGTAQVVTPEAPPPPAAPLSPQLTTRLSQLVEQARGAHQRFSGKRANAERLVAAGGSAAPGS